VKDLCDNFNNFPKTSTHVEIHTELLHAAAAVNNVNTATISISISISVSIFYTNTYATQQIPELIITRAKDVLPNINHSQAPEITPRQQRNGLICCLMLFAASAYHSYAAEGDGNAQHVFVPGDVDL